MNWLLLIGVWLVLAAFGIAVWAFLSRSYWKWMWESEYALNRELMEGRSLTEVVDEAEAYTRNSA